MKASRSILAASIIALFAASGAWAQGTAAAPTREEVKKEAIEARKAGEVPKGTADAAQSKATPAGKSTTTRAAGKTKAAEARKAGDIKCGEVDAAMGKAAAAKSTKSRADVKAEAMAAAKAGETPCGEAMPGQVKK